MTQTNTVLDRFNPEQVALLEQWKPFAISKAIELKPRDMEPEDAAGIGIEALMECLGTFNPAKSNLGTWAKYYVRFKMRNLRSHIENSIQTVPLAMKFGGEEEYHEADVAMPEPDEVEEADDRGFLAFQLLNTLPAAQSLALRLKLGLSAEGPQTFKVIGERLGGISKQRAEQLVKEGLATLKKRLLESEAKN